MSDSSMESEELVLPAEGASSPPSPLEDLEKSLDQILYGTYGKEEEGKLGDFEHAIEDLPERPLEPEEMFILALYFRGFGIDDIAHVTKHSFAYVQNILHLPLAQRIMAKVDTAYEVEIKGMKGLAIKTMRDILQTGDAKSRTTMVEKYFKVAGRFEEKENKNKTAEDVIAKMLEVIQTQTEITKQLTGAENVCFNGTIPQISFVEVDGMEVQE